MTSKRLKAIKKKDKELWQLFGAYLDDIFAIIPLVIEWWSQLLDRFTSKDLNSRWPFGPAGHPLILGMHRKHFTPIEALYYKRMDLNIELLLVPPREVLIDWLEEDYPRIHEFMASIVMPPIGELPKPLPTFNSLPRQLVQLPSFDPPLKLNFARGVTRLLAAPSDLRKTQMPKRGRAESFSHEALFLAYEHQLADALTEATDWWQGVLEARADRGMNPKDALRSAYEFCIAGPAGHEKVLGVLQVYWVLCEKLNTTLPPEQCVAPELMLLDWLNDGKHKSWVRILAGMPYWPLGIDTDGNWF